MNIGMGSQSVLKSAIDSMCAWRGDGGSTCIVLGWRVSFFKVRRSL